MHASITYYAVLVTVVVVVGHGNTNVIKCTKFIYHIVQNFGRVKQENQSFLQFGEENVADY